MAIHSTPTLPGSRGCQIEWDAGHTFESLEHGISGWGILHFYSQVDLVIAAGSRTLLEYPGVDKVGKGANLESDGWC